MSGARAAARRRARAPLGANHIRPRVGRAELQYMVSWEVVSTEPAAHFSSRVDTIQLRRVSEVRGLGAGARGGRAPCAPTRR